MMRAAARNAHNAACAPHPRIAHDSAASCETRIKPSRTRAYLCARISASPRTAARGGGRTLLFAAAAYHVLPRAYLFAASPYSLIVSMFM